MSYIHCSAKLYDFGWCHDIFYPQIQIILLRFYSQIRKGKVRLLLDQGNGVQVIGKIYFWCMILLIIRPRQKELLIMLTSARCWQYGNYVINGGLQFSWILRTQLTEIASRVYFASKLPTFKFLLMYHLLFLECCELPRIAFHQDRGEIKRNKLLLKLLLRTNLNLIFKELRHETLVSDGAWHRVRTDI